MYAIVGAAGKVGYATSVALRKANKPVRAILRNEAKTGPLHEIGCEIAIADLQDIVALSAAMKGAHTVQVVLPPPFQASDPVGEMREIMENIARALEQARPERILAISDYGAHVEQDIGTPSLFHSLEARFSRLQCQKIFLRSSEHMQNWGRSVPAAVASGILSTFYQKTGVLFPTVSAPDVGVIAANLLLRDVSEKDVEVLHAEGPRRYCVDDVAAALGQLMGRKFEVASIPRAQWEAGLEGKVPVSLAEIFIKANEALNKPGVIDVGPEGEVCYGTTELMDALRPLIPAEMGG